LFGPGYRWRDNLEELKDNNSDAVYDFSLFGPDENPFQDHPVKHFVYAVIKTFLDAFLDSRIPADGEFRHLHPVEIASSISNEICADFKDFTRLLSSASSTKLRKVLVQFATPFMHRCRLLLFGAVGLAEPNVERLPTDSTFDYLSRKLEVSIYTTLQTFFKVDALSAALAKAAKSFGRQFMLFRITKMSELLAWYQTARADDVEIPSPWDHLRRMQYPTLITYPLPYILTKLPARLETLLSRLSSVKCDNCEKQPPAPALCLVCGTYVCAHTYCCVSEDGTGECNQHASVCGGGKGMFLLVKNCTVILLDGTKGCIINAPYVDSHGEVDVDLRFVTSHCFI
jgi:hypothetical protein